MKLHALFSNQPSAGARAQELGRAIFSEATATKPAPRKIVPSQPKSETVDDGDQDMRDFAVNQLARSKFNSAHHKIRHYD